METEHIPVLYQWEHLFANQPVSLVANRHVLRGDFERHEHTFMELVLIVHGSGKHLSSSRDEPLRAGQAFVIPSGVWHAYHDCQDLIVYNCCFQLEVLQHAFLWGPDDGAVQRLINSQASFHRMRLTHEQVVLCQQHLESIIALQESRTIFKIHLLGHFLLFLATFLGPLAETIHRPEKPLLHPAHSAHSAIQQCRAFLEDEMALAWTLTTIAHKVGLTPSYLARLFQTQLGMPPMTYLSRKRAEHAMMLLEQTALPIREIGQRVGWPDSNHFARKFKAQMGISATRYRELCRESNTQQDQTHKRE